MTASRHISVQDTLVSVQQVHGHDYISLTDMARKFDERTDSMIQRWLRNAGTIDFLELWEQFNNPLFNPINLDGIRIDLTRNSFVFSVKQWITMTNAIGIQSKAGRYGGTYAHRDIAFEFATWLSPAFKFYLIQEFQRLKEQESQREKLAWSYRRFLSKVNYHLHTDSIKAHILPALGQPANRDWVVYADEADLLNVAVFGISARQWREANPELARQGNIRDHADLIQLSVMANLESLNSVLIGQGMAKYDRFDLLVKTAVTQYERLSAHLNARQLPE